MIFYNFVINLFLDIKKKIYFIIDDKEFFIRNRKNYESCMYELMHILNSTLKKLDKLYYKYILSEKIKNVRINR
jgi:hypothetical protein